MKLEESHEMPKYLITSATPHATKNEKLWDGLYKEGKIMRKVHFPVLTTGILFYKEN